MAIVTKGASPNAGSRDYKDLEGRAFLEAVQLHGGVDQETSKFLSTPGTLFDSMNYYDSPRGYERARGLWGYDGVIDVAPSNMIIISVLATEVSTVYATPFAFQAGTRLKWGPYGEPVEGYGTFIFETVYAGPVAYVAGIFRIEGRIPEAGDNIRPASSTSPAVGTLLDSSLTYDPCELKDAQNPQTGAYLANTVSSYVSFINTKAIGLCNDSTISTIKHGYNTYRGLCPGTGPITGGWQLDDSAYVVRDAYSCYFTEGGNDDNLLIYPGDLVKLPYTIAPLYEYARVLRVVKTDGNWEQGTAEGWLVFGPCDAATGGYTTGDLRRLDALTIGEADPNSVMGYDILNAAGTVVVAHIGNAMAMGTDENYHQIPIGGLVWKASSIGWEWIQTGWEVGFVLGNNAPAVLNAPLFQGDLISATKSGGLTLADAGTTVASGVHAAWVTPGNIISDNGAYATANIPLSSRSDVLTAGFPTTIAPLRYSKIVGVEVTVQARFTGAVAPTDLHARLVYGDTYGDKYVSDSLATRTALTGAAVNYVYGGSTNLWGLAELTADQLNAASFGVELQYENNDPALAGQAEIDVVWIEVFYVPDREKVYFHDTVANVDVATGYVVAYQQEGGDFTVKDTAYGTMTFDILAFDPEGDYHSMNGVYDIIPTIELWTGALGTGTQIATVSTMPKFNLLPSSLEMEAEESLYQTVKANFFENEETAAIYGVTGASPAFSFGNSGFFFIHTPVALGEDKPRHVAFHNNRLALGYKPGFISLSAVGAPSDFFGTTGANPSLWGVGDRVTGLVQMAGNILVVFSESSIRTLEGSGEEDGTMRVTSAVSGAKEYTAVVVGTDAIYADNWGVARLSATDKYGDLAVGQLTSPIREWVSSRVQDLGDLSPYDLGPVTAIAVRSRNQYRLFYEDGYILVLYFAPDGSVSPTFMNYDSDSTYPGNFYAPTWVDSSVLSDGRERTVLGIATGQVYVADGADAIYNVSSGNGRATSETPRCWITTNPLRLGGTQDLGKALYLEVQGRYYGGDQLYFGTDSNFDFDKTVNSTTYDATAVAGDLTGAPINYARSEIVRPYLPNLTDGATFKIFSMMNAARAHVLQSLLVRASSKGVNRNRASKEY